MKESDIVVEFPGIVIIVQKVFGHEEDVAANQSACWASPKVDLSNKVNWKHFKKTDLILQDEVERWTPSNAQQKEPSWDWC